MYSIVLKLKNRITQSLGKCDPIEKHPAELLSTWLQGIELETMIAKTGLWHCTMRTWCTLTLKKWGAPVGREGHPYPAILQPLVLMMLLGTFAVP